MKHWRSLQNFGKRHHHKLNFALPHQHRLDSRTVNAQVYCTEGQELESQDGQILHSVANSYPPF